LSLGLGLKLLSLDLVVLKLRITVEWTGRLWVVCVQYTELNVCKLCDCDRVVLLCLIIVSCELLVQGTGHA